MEPGDFGQSSKQEAVGVGERSYLLEKRTLALKHHIGSDNTYFCH